MITLRMRPRKAGELAQAPIDGSMRIEVNRRRLALQAIAGLVAIAGGLIAIVLASSHLDPFAARWSDPLHWTDTFVTPLWAHIAGALFALLGGLLAWLRGVARLQDGDAALVLSPRGLLIKTEASGREVGLIPWTAVQRFSTRRLKHNRFIVVHLRDPARWLPARGLLGSLRQRLRARIVGSPLTICANNLQAAPGDLERLLQRYLAQYGSA